MPATIFWAGSRKRQLGRAVSRPSACVRWGSNVVKAISAFEAMTGEAFDPGNAEGIEISLDETGGPAFVRYTITPQDAAYGFAATIPEDYEHKAQLQSMAFTSMAEMLAERFHMDEAYLKELNPGVDFARAGTVIQVANYGHDAGGAVRRIIADKLRKRRKSIMVCGMPSSIASFAPVSSSTRRPCARSMASAARSPARCWWSWSRRASSPCP